ncbi:MaoC family dehydratase [Actinomycetota bacterium]
MSDPTAIDTLARQSFEDYVAGAVYEFGAITVDETEVISFARQFDPQPFHTDPTEANEGHFGGLIASGWHTGALAMRLLVDHFLPITASLGSPGVDEMRWTRPVRPGDELSLRVTILEARRSTSKPDRGFMRTHIEVLNQHRDVVMSMKAMNLMACAT